MRLVVVATGYAILVGALFRFSPISGIARLCASISVTGIPTVVRSIGFSVFVISCATAISGFIIIVAGIPVRARCVLAIFSSVSVTGILIISFSGVRSIGIIGIIVLAIISVVPGRLAITILGLGILFRTGI
jgi:hypothetical protein